MAPPPGPVLAQYSNTVRARFPCFSVIATRILLALGPLLAGFLLIGCGEGDTETSDPDSRDLFESRTLVSPGSFTSGIEGPAVDAEGNLYAVDYKRNRTIGIVPPDGEASVFVDLPEGSRGNGIRFDSEGTMLVADYTGHNVLAVDPEAREVRVHAHEPRMNQPNDLAIGADDRLYASDPNWSDSTGQLWRIDPDGGTTLLEADMGTTNGIEVGPDNQTLYVNESVQRKVWAYDLSADGEISGKRLLIEFPDHGLDGMRADVDGNLYITRHGKATVVKVTPEGEVLREIQLQGKTPTNITFGGEEGRQAYVTVADRQTIETFRVDRPGRSWALRQSQDR